MILTTDRCRKRKKKKKNKKNTNCMSFQIPVAVLASRIASCSDDDIADVHTFSIENSPPYSDYFEMDAETSKLSLAQV